MEYTKYDSISILGSSKSDKGSVKGSIPPNGELDEFQRDNIPKEGGTAEPGDNFVENLKNPGRMTGALGPGPEMLQVNTLFILRPHWAIRRHLHALVNSSFFDPFILGCILFSSALLTIENTTDETDFINTVLM